MLWFELGWTQFAFRIEFDMTDLGFFDLTIMGLENRTKSWNFGFWHGYCWITEIQAAGSTYGNYFRVTTYGESHGGGVGCIIDGCPPRLPLSEADMQVELDRRYWLL